MGRHDLTKNVILGKAYSAGDLEQILCISRCNVFRSIDKVEKAKDFEVKRERRAGTLFYVFTEYKEVKEDGL